MNASEMGYRALVRLAGNLIDELGEQGNREAASAIYLAMQAYILLPSKARVKSTERQVLIKAVSKWQVPI